MDLDDKECDPNANVSRSNRAEDVFSPDVDIVLNDFSEPGRLSSGLMTPFDPNLDFEAGLKRKGQATSSGENKENEGADGNSLGYEHYRNVAHVYILIPKLVEKVQINCSVIFCRCSKLADDLLAMYRSSSYCDVTIVAGDSEFKAHG